MSEQAPEQEAPQEGVKTFDADYVDKLRKEAAKYRTEAKENADAAKRLAQIEESTKTETEKLLEARTRETEQQVRRQVAVEYGSRLARSEFLAAAAKRNASHDASTILDDLNLARYVGEDGEPDAKEIAAAVERLIPAPAADTRPKGDVGTGPRTTPPALADGNPQSLIAAGLAANAAAKR